MAATNKSKEDALAKELAEAEKVVADAKKFTKPENEKVAQKRMAAVYGREPLVEVSVSPLYRNEFSNNQPVLLNGIRIDVPCDGRTYKIPESFAMEIKHRITLADEKFKRLNKMADIPNNFERSPGELKLFR